MMLSYLRRKRVPPWDTHLGPPDKWWRNLLVQQLNKLVIFCCLFALGLMPISPSLANSNTPIGSFAPTEVVGIPWGSGQAEVGFLQVPGQNYGPQGFAVNENNSKIYILDSMNQRILGFDLAGNSLIEIPLAVERGNDICVVNDKDFYVLYTNSKSVVQYDSIGNTVATFSIPEQEPLPVLPIGFQCGEEELVIEVSDGTSILLATTTLEQQPIRLEGWKKGNRRLTVHLLNASQGILRDPETKKTVLSIQKKQDSLEGLFFIGIDTAGHTYIIVEEVKQDSVERYLRKYTADEVLIAEVRLPYSNFAYTFKDVKLTLSGEVFQIIPLTESLEVLKWTFVDNKKTRKAEPRTSQSVVDKLFVYQEPRDEEFLSGDAEETTSSRTRKKLTPITRDQIIKNAEVYLNSSFSILARQCTSGTSCGGKNVRTPYQSATTVTGMPYGWGHYDTPSEFKTKLANGTATYAGDRDDSAGFGSSCVVGIDCSGLVSRAWNISRHSTSTLANVSDELAGFDNLKKGDIVNWAGKHVRVFVKKENDGRFQMIESTPPNVTRLSYSRTQLNSYKPLRYQKVEDANIIVQFDKFPTVLSKGDEFEVKFTLKNEGSQSVTLDDIYLAVADANSKHKDDLPLQNQVKTFTAGQSVQFSAQMKWLLATDLSIGKYKLIAKVKRDGQCCLELGEKAFEIWPPSMMAYKAQKIIREDKSLLTDEKRDTFIAILIRALEKRTSRTLPSTHDEARYNNEAYFSDISDAKTGVRREILQAQKLGILTVKADKEHDEFRPKDTITRAEAIALTVRTFEVLEKKIVPQCTPAFADFPTDPKKQWMVDVMQKGFTQYLTSGYTINSKRYFKPDEKVPRHEAVAFVENVVKQMKAPSSPRTEGEKGCTFVPPQVPDEEVVIDLPRPVVGETFIHPATTYQLEHCKYDKKTCANKSRYHSGIDYSKNGDRNIIASNAGTIVHVEKMHSLDHGMGSNVIIEHTLENGKKIYSSYSHLASIDPKIQKDKLVSKGQKIGVMGGSGYGKANKWVIHLHFEMKDGPVTKNPSGSGQYWGYMPSSANNYGYHDPNLYIGKVKVVSGVNPSIKTLNKQSGDIQIRELNASEGIKVTVEGKTVATKLTAEGINLNTGIPLENFEKPLNIIVSDKAGKALFNTYYPFSDVPPNEWYTNAIIQLWKADIINGRDSGLFGIGKAVKRAEILKMALLSGGHKGPFALTDTSFNDVDKTHGLSGYIKYARDKGFVSDGGKDKDFRPNDSAKRDEVAKIITKSADILSGPGIWIKSAFGLNTCPKNFTDLKAKAWYCPYINTVYQYQLMKGNKRADQFRPGEPMKREEAAVTACRVYFYRTQSNTSPCEKEGG